MWNQVHWRGNSETNHKKGMIFHVVATDKCSRLILLYWFVSSFVFSFWSLSDLQTSNQVAQVVQIFYYGMHMWLTRRFSVYSRTVSRAWRGYLETLWGGTGGELPEPYSMTSSSLLVWMFGSLVGGQWWSGEEYQANGTLTAVRYWYEILRAIIRPYTGSMAPGFLLMHDNACPHVPTVCVQFLDDEGIDAIDWPSCSLNLNPIENL